MSTTVCLYFMQKKCVYQRVWLVSIYIIFIDNCGTKQCSIKQGGIIGPFT